jgi:hypothetical protein
MLFPNTFDPEEYITDEETVCTTNVVAVKLPATVNAFAYDAVCAYDADNAFDPEITPVVVTAPEALIDISVVEPFTNVTLPLVSVFIILFK